MAKEYYMCMPVAGRRKQNTLIFNGPGVPRCQFVELQHWLCQILHSRLMLLLKVPGLCAGRTGTDSRGEWDVESQCQSNLNTLLKLPPKTPVFCTLTQCCQLSLTKIPFLEKPLKPCFVRMCQLKTIFKFWNPSPPPYGRCVNTQDNSTAGIQYALLYLRLHIQDCLIQRQYTRQ